MVVQLLLCPLMLVAGAFDYLLTPAPDIAYVVERVRAAMLRHAFEVSFQAMVKFLTRRLKEDSGAGGLDHAERLRGLLAEYRQERRVHVVVHGTASLVNVVVEERHWVTQVDDLDEVLVVAREVPVQVLVYVEPDGGPDGAEAIRQLRTIHPNVGVLVVARKRDLKCIVDAIGVGVGDYLLPDMEDPALFVTRLRRLVARQRRVERCYNLLASLKRLNVDLLGEDA